MILCAPTTPTPAAALAGLGEGSPFFRGRLIPRLSDAEREAVARGIMAIEDMHFRRLPALTAKVRALEAAAAGPVPGLAELRVRLGRTASEVTGIMLKIQEAKEEARRRGMLDGLSGLSASTFMVALAIALLVITMIDRFLQVVVPSMNMATLEHEREAEQLIIEAMADGRITAEQARAVRSTPSAMSHAVVATAGIVQLAVVAGLLIWGWKRARR